jgi:hypothetical protein
MVRTALDRFLPGMLLEFSHESGAAPCAGISKKNQSTGSFWEIGETNPSASGTLWQRYQEARRPTRRSNNVIILSSELSLIGRGVLGNERIGRER